MTTSQLDLNQLVDTALRGVVREALAHIAERGTEGDQQFLVDFRTNDDGVEMPSWLRDQFPERIRIVLQNQFWNLVVDDEVFSVDLRFGGSPASLTVPFAAIEAFVDPSVPFGLTFRSIEDETADEQPLAADREPTPEAKGEPRGRRGSRPTRRLSQAVIVSPRWCGEARSRRHANRKLITARSIARSIASGGVRVQRYRKT